jgi:hypothetical protein
MTLVYMNDNNLASLLQQAKAILRSFMSLAIIACFMKL